MRKRVLYQDVVPYETPTSLGVLRGPADGVVVLPLGVYWEPDATADLCTTGGVEKLYESVVREGRDNSRKRCSTMCCCAGPSRG